MNTAIPVAWLGLPEDCAPTPPSYSGFEFIPTCLADLPRREVAVALLDVCGPVDLGAVLSGCVVPALVRTSPECAGDLLPQLRPQDDLCLLDEPLVLVAHRLRRLLRGPQRDSLTGLFDRRAFYERLDAEVQAASPGRPLSFLLLDLDHFKAINDQHGHRCGDRVLQHCGGLLPNHAGVFAARVAGDEFGLLLPGVGEASALICADELCHLFRTHPAPEGITCTVSIGIATAEQPLPAEQFFDQAGEALYAAKAHGRDCAVHLGVLYREALQAGRDVCVENFENAQRVWSERLTESVVRRGRRLLEVLRNQADRDGLTDLFNRRYLDRRLEHEYQEARRCGRPLAVALLDVDFFGPINKTHGWPTGDRTLRAVANRVREQVRADDWVARYGGEEIAVVLPGATAEAAAGVLERVRQAIAAHPFRSTQGEPFAVTVSAGVVELRADDELPGLWDRLSARLLDAKRGGRNQVRS
jgi:diguanylate cyclase (GGDEF)-like protein